MSSIPDKPKALPVTADAIPEWLRRRDRWILWRYDLVDGRWGKVPYHASGKYRASSTGPSSWSSFADVWEGYSNGGFEGIGFVLGDGVAGVDIDHCIKDFEIHPDAQTAMNLLDDAYLERSPSGDGYLLLFETDYSVPCHKNRKGMFEFYTEGRYFTVTGMIL